MAFVLYFRLMLRGQKGSGWLLAGLALTASAAVTQNIKGIRFTFILSLDHNGVFHLLQLASLHFLLKGLAASQDRE